MARLRKKQKRLQLINGQPEQKNFGLIEIIPLTINQRRAFVQFKNKHLFLHGAPGTGKTFIAMYLALKEIDQNPTYKKLYIFRSVVPGRDMGFLPGSQKEKAKVYEDPYVINAKKLYDRGDAYDILKSKHLVEFHTTSFTRGITLDDCIVLVDELQNLNSSEIHTIMTRIGENCKIIFSGDISQTDLNKPHDKTGLKDFYKIIKNMKEFDLIEFSVDDIVRSSIVRSYVMARMKLEDEGKINSLQQI